ncbi:MAG: S8 family serine peptidase [Gemmatimonadota bacterium]|jgi:hypothetical protein
MYSFPDRLAHPTGPVLTRRPTLALLSLAHASLPGEDSLDAALGDLGCALLSLDPERERRTVRLNQTPAHRWIRDDDPEPLTVERVAAFHEALGDGLRWVGPVYGPPDAGGYRDLSCPRPDVLLVREADALRSEVLASLLEEHGFRIVSEGSLPVAGFRRFATSTLQEATSYAARDAIVTRRPRMAELVRFSNIPLVSPALVEPDDPQYGAQWNVRRIGAGGTGVTGWDLSAGSPGVTIAVLDDGCDLDHPDLDLTGPGVNLGNPSEDADAVDDHGTRVAGVAAAVYDNAAGVAGVAGKCRILPLRMDPFGDAQVAAGLTLAADQGADVVVMSFGGVPGPSWDAAVMDPSVAYAHGKGCVLVAGTGNDDDGTSNLYPARHPRVMACGGSDKSDERWSDPWVGGSHYGEDIHLGERTGVSVVAPAVNIWTTDLGGGYWTFGMTSAATPHVGGLAALVRSLRPGAPADAVRRLIERTAEKVGSVAYADDVDFPNGSRNQEMGHGRINVFRALDQADVYIRDWPGDAGVEPSSPPGGNFWATSDIVVRPADDGVFDPTDPSEASRVVRGQESWIYVRIRNAGPAPARNVSVDVRITPWVGLQFVYPGDWTLTDSTHVAPSPSLAAFAGIPAGGEVIAKFTLTAAQVDALWGWGGLGWHPCLLARVRADNDYAFQSADTAGGKLVIRRNNLAQRNLTVVEAAAGSSQVFPVIAGHRRNPERWYRILLVLEALPPGCRVSIEPSPERSLFPRFAEGRDHRPRPVEEDGEGDVRRLPGRIEEELGASRGRQGVVNLVRPAGSVRVVRLPGDTREFHLVTTLPDEARAGARCRIDVHQQDERGRTVGGATVEYRVRERSPT